MPIRNYPFSKIREGRRRRPMLWVRVINSHSGVALPLKCLVDTGADRCAFPATAAEYLGHDLLAGERNVILTANGQTCAYAHTCRMEILGIRSDDGPGAEVLYAIPDTPIDFVQANENFLLGVDNFLGNFVLTIDYKNKNFSLTLP